MCIWGYLRFRVIKIGVIWLCLGNDREVPLGLDLNKIAANIFAPFLIAIHAAERIWEKDQSQDDKHDEDLDQDNGP